MDIILNYSIKIYINILIMLFLANYVQAPVIIKLLTSIYYLFIYVKNSIYNILYIYYIS